MLLMEKAHRAPEVEYRSSIDDERREEIARHVRWAMAGLALLGFLLRVGAIFYLKRWQFPNAMEHQTIALSLLQNGTFYFRDFGYYGPTSVQSPPYPVLLFVLFKIFGANSAPAFTVAMLINAVAGAITIWLTFKMIRALGGSDAAAVLAAALVAVCPSKVYAAVLG